MSMATIQIRIDDTTKVAADSLFASRGLDTSTAVRMFIAASLENDGIPFSVRRTKKGKPNTELLEAIEDIRLGRNLHGPFANAEEAVLSMLKD
jgi:DNA-damage-inducible protein J